MKKGIREAVGRLFLRKPAGRFIVGATAGVIDSGGERVMQIHYLEIVTREVDAVCVAYAAANEVQFGEPDAGLGNARTATLSGDGLVGVRAPMNETEGPSASMVPHLRNRLLNEFARLSSMRGVVPSNDKCHIYGLSGRRGRTRSDRRRWQT